MTGFFALLRRELFSLWVTPLAWVALFAFLLLQGISFYLMVDYHSKFTTLSIDQGPVQGYFSSLFIPVSLLLVCPSLSMRLLAEERRSGTIEPLLTAPVSALSVVLSKYLATLGTYLAFWLPTVLYLVILRETGAIDWGAVLASYLGVGLVGASYLAIGLLMSTLTKSQLLAAMLTTLAIFGVFILGVGERVFDPGPLRDLCAHVSILSQLDELSRGLVDLRRLVFDLSVSVFCLFLAVRVVASWRWD